VSGSFLLGAVLLAFAFGSVPPERTARLAALGAAALLAHSLLSVRTVRSVLGPFADALHLTAGLLFLLTAMALTGGTGSELYPLLLVDVVLACALLGIAAGRFLTLATVSGVLILAALTAVAATPSPLGLALRALAPAALLVAFEFRARRPVSAENAYDSELPPRRAAFEPPARATSEAPAPSAGEDTASQTKGEYIAPQLLHDLRSPLTVMRLYADILADQARRGEPAAAEHVENLRAELNMAESLLDPDRRPAAPASDLRERIDLVKMLEELISSYSAAHAGRLRIEFITEQAALPVLADPLALRRAFRNVLDNAVKYTQAGGRVRVRAGEEDGQASVVISDTGVGMSASEQERAFEPSFRGAAARWSAPGRGLGLGITRELLKTQGGTIALDSTLGHGSEVTIRLPLAGERS
jgi:signal transduction histidine kinase